MKKFFRNNLLKFLFILIFSFIYFSFICINQNVTLIKIPYDTSFYNLNKNLVLFIRKEFYYIQKEFYESIKSLWIADKNFINIRFISYLEYLVSVSPDKSKIIIKNLDSKFSSVLSENFDGKYYLIDLLSGEKKVLPDLGYGKILWSEDNKYLYFEKGIQGVFKYDIYLSTLEKIMEMGKTQKITDVNGKTYIVGPFLKFYDIYKNLILYIQDSVDIEILSKSQTNTLNLEKHLWLIDPINGYILCIDKVDANIYEKPQFSPDGNYILYKKGKELWISSIDGKDKKPIGIGSDAVFSDDGKKIAFVDKGLYEKNFEWLNLCIYFVETNEMKIIPKIQNWKNEINKYQIKFIEWFDKHNAFTYYLPNIKWFSDSKRLIFNIGWEIYFIADIDENLTKPYFFWNIQIDSFVHYITKEGNITLSCPFIDTERRKEQTIFEIIKTGLFNERDIWQISTKNMQKKMLIENGEDPIQL